jgi:MFS family permease
VAIALAGLTALAVAMGIGRFAFTPILPMMQADTGLTVSHGAWLASVNYAGYLLGALSAVVIRARPAVMIRAGLIAIGVGTVAMGLAHQLAVWFALRLAAGVASAWVLIFVSAWCLERIAHLRRPLLNSTVFAGVGTGLAVAGAACLVLMRAGASAAQAWIGLGAVALAATALIWSTFAPEDGALPRDHGRSDPRARPWDAESGRLVFGYGAYGFGYIIPATFLPVMARAAIQDPAVFGWAWPIFGAAAAISTLIAGATARFLGNRRLWIATQLLMAAGVAVPILWPGIAGIMLAALLVGGTFVVITMAGMQEARHVRGQHATGLMAALTSAFAAGQIAGPLYASAVVAGEADFSRALLVAAIALLAGAAAIAYPWAR